MRIVIEFGGSAISDHTRIDKSLKLLRKRITLGDHIAIVVSALPNVTDELIKVAENAKKGDIKNINQLTNQLKRNHTRIADNFIKGSLSKEAGKHFQILCDDLHKVLIGIAYLKELSARSRDFVLSFGERLATTLIYYCITSLDSQAKYCLSGDCGIVTDEAFGDAQPLFNVCKVELRRFLEPIMKQKIIPVVTGFIGKTQDGIITTLGRGGSDYTATLLGAALKADEVWILGEVEGILTADPQIEPDAQIIPLLSYDEAMEMAHFRGKAIHPRALEPVVDVNIPVRIMSSLRDYQKGTLITKKGLKDPVVKAITMINDVAMITVSGGGMKGAPGTAATIFKVLGDHGVNILMISQSSSEVNISVVIPEENLDKAIGAFEMSVLGRKNIQKITPEPNVAVISVIGAGMKGTIGIASKMFEAVTEQGINVRMIAQGSSETNISIVVAQEEADKAVRSLHSKFYLDTIADCS